MKNLINPTLDIDQTTQFLSRNSPSSTNTRPFSSFRLNSSHPSKWASPTSFPKLELTVCPWPDISAPLVSAPWTWTLTVELSAQQLVEHPLLHCWVCIFFLIFLRISLSMQNFCDETNWSVFRRWTQDPPFDEATSTCATLSCFQTHYFYFSTVLSRLCANMCQPICLSG